MSEILRTRVIRPATRKASSSSYKIDTKLVGPNDTLRVEVAHESKPGRWIFTFSGRVINGRDSISFRVSEMSGKVDIRWGSLQPEDRTYKSYLSSFPKRTIAPTSRGDVSLIKTERKYSFPPVISEGCTVLVLGSMPGDKSLELQQYYAHPRNRFWSVIESLIGEPAPASYQERIEWLTINRIALWDVAHHCERTGSLDSNIQNEAPNDIIGLLKDYLSIRCIAFNGGKAATMFNRLFVPVPGLVYHVLPSTSPANTVTMTYLESQWSVLKSYTKGGSR